MSGRKHIFFKIHASVSEGADGFARRRKIRVLRFCFRVNQANASAAAARAGFEHDRIAELRRFLFCLLRRFDCFAPRDHRKSRFPHQFLERRLVTESLHVLRLRSDKDQSVFAAESREIGVFRQESISRMDCLRTVKQGCRDDLLLIQIAGRRLRTSDAAAFICEQDMQCVPVGLGINRHRLHAHFPARSDDAHSNFAAIGDQNFRKHRNPLSARTKIPR